MTHLLRTLCLTAVLAAAICLTPSARAEDGAGDGWQRGGNFKDSRYDHADSNSIETQARESDGSITTDKPATAEPFLNPNDIQDDEDED
jgi:hypothetical protein